MIKMNKIHDQNEQEKTTAMQSSFLFANCIEMIQHPHIIFTSFG